jgi:iron-sulfur cluster repair protein YtfE (RIC family)
MTKPNSRITADWTVNAVVGTYPTSLPVFGRYGIDSCCGGLKTLREVSEAHHLPLDRLLADLVHATTRAPLVLDV